MTPLSWEHWANRYRERGHQVLTPAWPGLEGEPEEIRRDPSPLQGLSITDVIDRYEKIIRELDRPPIIIGHSFGGLYAQLLLNRGLGSAGAALGTGAPKGVLRLPYSTIRAAWTALHNPFGKNNVAPLTAKQFHWCFTNSLSREDSDAVYERYYIPGSARPLLPGRLRELQPERSDEGRLPESEPAAARPGHGCRGPHLPAFGQRGELQETAPGTHGHGAQGVRGPLSLPRPEGLGRSRGLRLRLDDRARDHRNAEHGLRDAADAHRWPDSPDPGCRLALVDRPHLRPAGPEVQLRLGDELREARGSGGLCRRPRSLDAILLTHDHHDDNLDPAGRALLASANATVITTASGAVRLGRDARGLRAWETTTLRAPGRPAIEVTATPSAHRHPLSRPLAGDVVGFALRWDGQDSGLLDLRRHGVSTRWAWPTAWRSTSPASLGGVQFPVTGPVRYTLTAKDAVELCRLSRPRVRRFQSITRVGSTSSRGET